MDRTGEISTTTERPCPRCKEQPVTHELRSEPVCGSCFCSFARVKAAKRFEVLDRESRNTVRRGTAHYLLGLSFGPSSSAMVQIFDELDERFSQKKRPVASKFHVVHVDYTDIWEVQPRTPSPALELLGLWRARYPRFEFECVPLTSVVGLRSLDWSALPKLKSDRPREEQLRDLFDSLPSLTSRADAIRLFVRHLLINWAASHGCCAVLLGNSTTSLAALTLAETAKGRGFSLPWLTSDGSHSIPDYAAADGGAGASGEQSSSASTSAENKASAMVIHYPLRELYRKELAAYAELTGMDRGLIHDDSGPTASKSVVSHRDLSIDDVMTRYFDEVEQNYPSIVANVVRTTAKLTREDPDRRCGLCGAAVDDEGNEKWSGELGGQGEIMPEVKPLGKTLCYGCERSVHG